MQEVPRPHHLAWRGKFIRSNQQALVPVCASSWLLTVGMFIFQKKDCSRQVTLLNNAVWNNGIGPWFYFVDFPEPKVIVKRDSPCETYCGVRGEIL